MMRNLTAVFFLILLASVLFAADFSSKLAEAEKLKFAERYEEATYIYDQILKESPSNEAALKGKDDCRVMLSPVIPEQHLLVPVIDPGQLELDKKFKDAKTPWDKRRAELALERYAVRYTGEMFGKSSKDAKKKADSIIDNALKSVKLGTSPEAAYLEAEKSLNVLQEAEDRSWKGHGPKVLETSLNRLDRLYIEKAYPKPYDAFSVSFSSVPRKPKKDGVALMNVTLKNISDAPVILIDLRLDNMEQSSFSWQGPAYGSLEYNEKSNTYIYNCLAQQETYSYFNNGLLFPGQSAGFSKKMRVPGIKSYATVRYALVDDELLKKIYVAGTVTDEYRTADLGTIEKTVIKKSLKVEESLFPSKSSILFIDDGVKLLHQKFLLK